ncbi:hypothetical protein [Natronococcus jeotgali]|nr:hypothetical protein [Natronococcus jeotgali]
MADHDGRVQRRRDLEDGVGELVGSDGVHRPHGEQNGIDTHAVT